MEPLEMLSELRQSMPKVRQFLNDSLARAADPELQTRIAKVVATLDENFAVMDQELPAYFNDLNARKAKAEGVIREGIVQMQKAHADLIARKREEQARIRDLQAQQSVTSEPIPAEPVASLDEDDPSFGSKIREGLLNRYVRGYLSQREDKKAPTFEDWTDSVVQLEIPPVAHRADKDSPTTKGQARSPRSFESWLDGGSTIGQDAASEPGAKPSDDAQKLNQEFLKYVRKKDGQ